MAPAGRSEYRGQDRRRQRRRDEDVAEHEIAERVMHDTSTVNRVVRAAEKSTKLVAAAVAIGGVIGSGITIAILLATFPAKVEANTSKIKYLSERQDSLVAVLIDFRATMKQWSYVQCVSARIDHPELIPDGCPPAPPRSPR